MTRAEALDRLRDAVSRANTLDVVDRCHVALAAFDELRASSGDSAALTAALDLALDEVLVAARVVPV